MKNVTKSSAIRKATPPKRSAANSTDRRKTFLPGFGGFNGTHWEDLLISSEALYAEMYAAGQDGDDAPDEMELREMLSEFSDVSRHCASIARAWCACFEEKMTERLGFAPRLKFERLESPGDYTFTTDRIVATVPITTARRLFELSEKENHRSLSKLLRNWFTPMPHHSEFIRAWVGDKRLDRWDKNELCLLLDAFTDPDVDDEIYAAIGDGAATTAFEDAVDWKKFEAALARRRTPPAATRRRVANRERSKA